MTTTAELRDRLLVACLLKARQEGYEKFLDANEVAASFGLDSDPARLRLVCAGLKERSLVKTYVTSSGTGILLTNNGVEVAEEILEDHPEYGISSTSTDAPASNRWVKLTDNQRIDLSSDLEALRTRIRSANDVDSDTREIALSEVAAFEATIVQPRVSADLIERFVKRIIAWIRSKFGEALLGAVAGALIEKLLPFLS